MIKDQVVYLDNKKCDSTSRLITKVEQVMCWFRVNLCKYYFFKT